MEIASLEEYPRQYTLGIGTTKNSIVLIEKNRPEWQKGSYNFPGGKIDPGENHFECIAREWEEETGIHTEPYSWEYIGKMYRPKDFVVYLFFQENEEFTRVYTKEDQPVVLMRKREFITNVYGKKYTPNLIWLYHFVEGEDFTKYKTIVDIYYPGNDFV